MPAARCLSPGGFARAAPAPVHSGTLNSEVNIPAPAKRIRRFSALILLFFAAALVADAFWIEPYSIEVTRWRVNAPLAPPLKIAHVSDLHTHGLGRRERQLLALLDAERPDIIVISGDTVAETGTYDMCREVLSRLHAPLGVWVVRGNWENWRPLKHERAFYQSAGVHFLLNSGAPVRPGVWLAGLDDPWTGDAKPDAALAGAPPGAFTIFLFHSPGYFDQLAGRCNLALAGHTHGGQVRPPFIRPFWLPGGCGRFLEGWYEQGGSRLYVSRGVGTSQIPARFRCRPELAMITAGP